MTEMQADPILGMRRALDDPRVTQALMVLQGGGSSIKITDDDMKEAERKGHIKKPDALQLPEIQKAYKCKDCYECKDLGNSHFKKGETNQALAYYDRGLQLIAEGTEKELSCSLLSNTAMGMLKLKHFAKAEQACNDAMRLIGEKTSAYSEIRAKLYHRRAMAREKLKKWCVQRGRAVPLLVLLLLPPLLLRAWVVVVVLLLLLLLLRLRYYYYYYHYFRRHTPACTTRY